MKSQRSTGSSLTILAARSVAFVVVLAWGWYMVASFRTQQFGFSPLIFAVALPFVLPVAFLPFLGLSWRAMLTGAALTLVLSVGAAEAFAGREEAVFQRDSWKQPSGTTVVYRDRQWPFGHHYMYFDPVTGAWGGGD